jgi:hypothetical protein
MRNQKSSPYLLSGTQKWASQDASSLQVHFLPMEDISMSFLDNKIKMKMMTKTSLLKQNSWLRALIQTLQISNTSNLSVSLKTKTRIYSLKTKTPKKCFPTMFVLQMVKTFSCKIKMELSNTSSACQLESVFQKVKCIFNWRPWRMIHSQRFSTFSKIMRQITLRLKNSATKCSKHLI